MSIEGDDRRAEGATRIPFEALVEVGGALGPSFEAQAVDVSEDGMHLRTAYLPEVGQPLTCRFDAGKDSVLASGEVVWRQEAGKGGEFGIRFTDLDAESAEALTRVTRVSPDGARAVGAKVRLHIDGLGSPMRARVRGSGHAELTVGSELGFLQVGKQLELEDASTGRKRAARIDRVEVEIDPESQVPQLVVALKYDDDAAMDGPPKEITPGPSVIDDDVPVTAEEPTSNPAKAQASADDAAILDESQRMKSAFARGVAKVGPTLSSFAKRAKVTLALLAARRAAGRDSVIPLRRVTAKAPTGGLHAEGRKVVRTSMPDATEAPETRFALAGKLRPTKRQLAIGGAAGALAIVMTAIAMHGSEPSKVAATPPTEAQAAAAAAPPQVPATLPPPTTPEANVAVAVSPPAPATPPVATGADDGASADDGEEKHARKRVHVAPFSNGTVTHGNVLRLKMDGVIEAIEGAPAPTGFTVVIPDRRSLEAAGPLASRDARIGSIKVTNDGPGAELAVTFKDGVPNYLVRAKGDVLEIVLAPIGAVMDRSAGGKPEAPIAKKRHHHMKR